MCNTGPRLSTSERILLQLEGINRRLDKVVEAHEPRPANPRKTLSYTENDVVCIAGRRYVRV